MGSCVKLIQKLCQHIKTAYFWQKFNNIRLKDTLKIEDCTIPKQLKSQFALLYGIVSVVI